MNQKNTESLGTELIGRLLFKLSVPAIAAQLVNLLYNLVDRMYIGHIAGIGRLAFTGMGVCMSLIMLISAFASLVSMGAAPRASIFLGKGDREKAERTLGNSAVLLVAVSAVLTVTLLLFSRPLLMRFGASEDTIGYALQYMNIYSLGSIFVLLTLGLNAFISAQGFSLVSMATVLIGAFLNIALDPLFIFVFDMGVSGAALATVISQAVSAAFVVIFLTGRHTNLRLKIKNFKLSSKIVLPSLALGASPFIMQSTESVLSICFNSSLQLYGGDIAVGAMTVLSSVMQFSMLPLHGLTQGAQPIISYNYGARKPDRVRSTFKMLLVCCLTFSFTIWALTMLFPRAFVMLFNADAALLDFAPHAMRIYMASSLIFGAQIACQQTFIAIGNARYSVFLALLRKVFLLIPLIYILPAIFANKTDAIFLAEPVADTIAVATTVALFAIQFKKAMASLSQK